MELLDRRRSDGRGTKSWNPTLRLPDEIQIDPLMGCSRSLISLVDETSSLVAHCGSNEVRETTVEQFNSLSQRLRDLHQYPPAQAAKTPRLAHCAEAKRLAALLYLENRLLDIGLKQHDDEYCHLVDATIEATSKLGVSNPATLWPLFVLGNAGHQSGTQAQFVVNRLFDLEIARKTGSISLARQLLELKIFTHAVRHGQDGGETVKSGRTFIEEEGVLCISLA